MPETDPCIRHGSRYTTHEERPDRLPLARIEQREHCESGAQVPRPGKRHEGKRWRRWRRHGDAERVTEGLRVDEAVNAAAEGHDADGGRKRREDALEAVWGGRHLFKMNSDLGVWVDLMKMEVELLLSCSLLVECAALPGGVGCRNLNFESRERLFYRQADDEKGRSSSLEDRSLFRPL